MAYLLNGTELPRPKQFKRRNLEYWETYLTVNGASARDISGKKEVFSLEWRDLTSSQLSTLTNILALNQTVTFEVDENNLTINETNVIVYMSEITYNTPGSSFLCSTSMDLIEVE